MARLAVGFSFRPWRFKPCSRGAGFDLSSFLDKPVVVASFGERFGYAVSARIVCGSGRFNSGVRITFIYMFELRIAFI
jgi:hypothetical protein